MIDWTLLVFAGIFAVIFSRIVLFIRNVNDTRTISGLVYPFAPYEFPGILLPTSSWNVGNRIAWVRRNNLYSKYDQELISIIPFLSGRITLYTNSAEVAKQILGNKSGFEKLPFAVETLAIFGENVFSSYQDRWLRHRRIVAPGFNQNLYAKVWDECMRTFEDMSTSEGWSDKVIVDIPDINTVASKLALFIIASCGFGQRLSWSDTVGGKVNGMTIVECFDVGSHSVGALIALPRWAFSLPIKSLRRIKTATETLETILRDIIAKRRALDKSDASEKGDEKDLFSLLLQANDAELDAKRVLTDHELVSNVFFMMLAGHETTSKALTSTLSLLACYPEAQKLAYEQIMSVMPAQGDRTYEDFDRLPYVQACLFEGLRLYPSAHIINRRPLEDKVLSVPTKDGRNMDVLVAKDTGIALDFIGMCYNPRHYPEPTKFLPSRWSSGDTEPLVMFSYGPRACVGKKFALTEAVCILALFLRNWKIEPVLLNGESMEEWRVRVLDGTATQTIGFGPGPVPLRLVRRTG